MELPKILELLIAVGLFYFLFSTLVSILFEWYAYKTEQRGRFLYETLHKLLQDPSNKNYGALFYSHFNLVSIRKNSHSYPQYISSEMFADTLIDIIGGQSEQTTFTPVFDPNDPTQLVQVTLEEHRIADPYERYCKGVEAMQYSPLKSILRSFGEKTTNYTELKAHLMKWYEDYMARVTGWYKSKIKNTLLILSFLVCITLNVDSISFIKKINADEELRKSLVNGAEQLIAERLKHNQKEEAKMKTTENLTFIVDGEQIQKTVRLSPNDSMYIAQINATVTSIQQNHIPIGYTEGITAPFQSVSRFLWWLLGIGLSTFALSFGAPFWFEVLVKAVNIRRSGIKPN
ncbi:MAG: hypothetical protein RL607_2439 [Bacteroidota bacterium]